MNHRQDLTIGQFLDPRKNSFEPHWLTGPDSELLLVYDSPLNTLNELDVLLELQVELLNLHCNLNIFLLVLRVRSHSMTLLSKFPNLKESKTTTPPPLPLHANPGNLNMIPITYTNDIAAVSTSA